jgi:hypothetical protein
MVTRKEYLEVIRNKTLTEFTPEIEPKRLKLLRENSLIW